MFSKEFMKFLFEYQKEDFKQKRQDSKTITFSTPKNGKLAEVLVMEGKSCN